MYYVSVFNLGFYYRHHLFSFQLFGHVEGNSPEKSSAVWLRQSMDQFRSLRLLVRYLWQKNVK